MKDKTIITLYAISVIGAIECYALYLSINGVVLTLVVAGLSGLGGYELNESIKKIKRIKEA